MVTRSSAPAIHQFSPSAWYGDAVTNGMLLTRGLLRGLGFASEIWVVEADARVASETRDVRSYRAATTDVLLVHHSLGHDGLVSWLATLPASKVLVYHNITPPEFFPDDPHLHRLAQLGRRQLTELRPVVRHAICDSAFNARELETLGYESTVVLPLLVDTEALARAPHDPRIAAENAGRFTMLSVGRIERNKAQHDVIDVFRHLSHLDGPAQCVLIGRFDPRASYVHELRRLSARHGVADRVRFLGHVSDEELRGWYRAADVFLSMSEHEGFCVPLVEAMTFGVPVIAHATGGVLDALGGAGIAVSGKPLPEVAALVGLVARDAGVRNRIIAHQRARARALGGSALAVRLATVLEGLGIAVPPAGRFALERAAEAMKRSTSTVSGLDLEPLRERARAEAAQEHREASSPVAGRADPVASAWAAAHRAMVEAERYVEVGMALPPMTQLTGWRRRLAVPVARMILRAAKLFTRDQRSFNVESMCALRAVAQAVELGTHDLEQRVAEVRLTQDAAIARLTAESARRADVAQHALEDAQRGVAALEKRMQNLELALGGVRNDLARLESALRRVPEDLNRLGQELRALQPPSGVAAEPLSVDALPERRGDAGRTPHDLDAFYLGLEDRFRGSQDEIRQRVSIYLPIVREAGAGTAERPVLDLGCGRGEWVEVLAGAGLRARGVDTNRTMVDESRARGLDVVECDALGYLRGLPAASCGAVTAIHLLEHLPFREVIALLDEVVRVLQPGGVAIFETPNPQNIMVGACFFYVDPTHRNPLHPATMAYVLEARGLHRVEVRYLHPAGEEYRLPDDGNPVVTRLNEYFFGPMDFAVIGHRT